MSKYFKKSGDNSVNGNILGNQGIIQCRKLFEEIGYILYTSFTCLYYIMIFPHVLPMLT